MLWLLRKLKSTHPQTRYQALQELQEQGDAQTIPHLIPLLQDEHEAIRGMAVQLIGTWGDMRSAFQVARCLEDESDAVRCLAVQALGKLLHPRTLEKIFASLPGSSLAYQHHVAQALQRFGTGTIRDLGKAARHPSPAMRLAAIGVLQKMDNLGGPNTWWRHSTTKTPG